MTTAKESIWEITEVLDELVALGWSTFIGSDLVRIDNEPPPANVVCSSIAISGSTSATVLFFADTKLAASGTAAVLGMELSEVSDDDIHDVIGELVNIIGGNLKGVVSDGEQQWGLSLPVVSNAMQRCPGSRLVAEVSFVTEGGTLGCHILEHSS
ncbi:MAG: hypothetical protein JWN62_1114 [Acidimicrobiales bacterium]|nr:hypothetical protein [Acidimicrobiales bacterium]